MTKPTKPDPDRELRRAEKREQDIRASLAKSKNTGPIITSIAQFFATYAEKPNPTYFPVVLGGISQLQLMALPEHRSSLGGAIAGVVALSPDLADGWRKGRSSDVATLIKAADALMPPFSDEEITRSGHVEYLWMFWVVTREAPVLQRVIRLAHRHDIVGETSLQLLHAHATMAEVQGALVQVLQARQAKNTPRQGPVPAGVPVEDIQALKTHLVGHVSGHAHVPDHGAGKGTTKSTNSTGHLPGQNTGKSSGHVPAAHPRKHLVLIGWLPGDAGGFLVVTTDGKKPVGHVDTWRQRKVIVRKAKPQELQMHKALIEAQEAP